MTLSELASFDLQSAREPLIINKTKANLDLLLELARDWSVAARKLASSPRGRNVLMRRQLAHWTGLRMARAGVRLTKGRDGKFAKVLEILYEAVGITVPGDMFKDLAYAFDRVAHDLDG